jgi:phosphohistidine phosphatase
MRLFLLRHGLAEEGHAGLADFDRALTAGGRAALVPIARGLHRLKVAPDALLSSPLVRARQTAEIVAPILGRQVAIADQLASGAGLEQIVEVIEQSNAPGSLMLVGHEPDFSTAAALLVGAPAGSLQLKKAGLIRIDLFGSPRPGSGRLRWLLTPRHLSLIGDA